MSEENVFCPSCGAKNPAGAKFCQGCGGEITIPSSNANTGTYTPVKEEPVKYTENLAAEESHTLAIVLGYIFSLLGSIIGIIASIYLQTRESPKAIMHGRIQAIIFGIWMLIMGATWNSIFYIVGIAIIAAMAYYILKDRGII